MRSHAFQRPATIALCIIVVTLAGYLAWHNAKVRTAAVSADGNPASQHIAQADSQDHPDEAISNTQANKQFTFAASLRGTAQDGSLRSDNDGNLVIERGIRDLFDYYLTTLGERDISTIRSELLAVFNRQLPSAAAQQATQLLDAYLDYRKQAGELQQQYPALTEDNAFTVIVDYFVQRDVLRERLFDRDAADAFFLADQANEQAALQKLQGLISGPSISDDAPAASHDDARSRSAMNAERNTIDAGSSSDALREQRFGREAADRLAGLDQRRSDWTARLASYREQKQQLLAATAQAGIDPSIQLKQLQHSQFSQREILRVQALDRLEQVDP